jgi:hypothetical protein
MDKGMEKLAETWEEMLSTLNSYDMTSDDKVSLAETLIQMMENSGADDWESLVDDPSLYAAARNLHPDFDWDDEDVDDED